MTTINFKKRTNHQYNEETGTWIGCNVDCFEIYETDETDEDKERLSEILVSLAEDENVFEVKVKNDKDRQPAPFECL